MWLGFLLWNTGEPCYSFFNSPSLNIHTIQEGKHPILMECAILGDKRRKTTYGLEIMEVFVIKTTKYYRYILTELNTWRNSNPCKTCRKRPRGTEEENKGQMIRKTDWDSTYYKKSWQPKFNLDTWNTSQFVTNFNKGALTTWNILT